MRIFVSGTDVDATGTFGMTGTNNVAFDIAWRSNLYECVFQLRSDCYQYLCSFPLICMHARHHKVNIKTIGALPLLFSRYKISQTRRIGQNHGIE